MDCSNNDFKNYDFKVKVKVKVKAKYIWVFIINALINFNF